ncbi:MAG: TSUP family transporter [Chloroflexi bacterium]|nr:TSUP family transporter [Chloroflexota bacterium]
MVDLVPLLVLTLTAVAASVVAAVARFGGAVVLLPVLVWVFGARDAVPILTVAQVVGNLSRVYFNRRELASPAARWLAVGSFPSSVIGALLFVAAPTRPNR